MKKNKIKQNLKKENKTSGDKSSRYSKKSNSQINNFECDVFAIGFLDLTFVIEFNDKEINQIKNGKTIEEINNDNIELIEFIKDNKALINRIKLNSKNESIKQFLLLNKTSKEKKKIEFFPIRYPKFQGKSEFFKVIFDKVTQNNGIIINPNSLDRNQEYSITIKLIHKKRFNSFEYFDNNEKETDCPILEESNQIKKEKIEYENEGQDGDNQWVKEGYIPKFKRKGCLLSKLRPSCKNYKLIYINYNEIQKIEGNFKEDDLIELLNFFKIKKSKIFVDFYKSIKSQSLEPPDDDNDSNEEDEENEENENNEADSHGEQKTTEDKIENEDDEKGKLFSKQKSLNKLYKLTDIFFFDENQAYQLFDKHLKFFNKKKSINKLDKTKIYDYFISSITNHSKGLEKIGLFLNDLENFTIVTCINNKQSKDTMDSKLYPKKTARNIEEINSYRTIIQENKDKYYNIITSLMLKGILGNIANIREEINSAFLGALTIIKKEIECIKNNITFKSNLINYKTIEMGYKNNKTLFSQKRKEEGFVLDCMNIEKSNLKEYVPLKDKNLKCYFRSKTNMKYLIQRGFVDNKGYIMYDKEYKKTFGSPDMIKMNKNKKSLSKVIKALSLKNKNMYNINCFKSNNYRTIEKVPK